MPQGNVMLDSEALISINEQLASATTQDDSIIIIVEDAKNLLNVRQQAKVSNRPVYDIFVKHGSNYISNFGNGIVTISLPYTLKPNEQSSNLVVYYLKDDGTSEKINSTYNTKAELVTFTTTHLSTYYIGYEEWLNSYGDIQDTKWYFEAVKYVSQNQIMNGTSDSPKLFSPDANLTRAMLVTILFNLVQPARGANTTNFTDVPQGTWYSDPVAWAASEGIVAGIGSGKFAPNADITRQDMMAILFRFAKWQGNGPIDDWAIDLAYDDVNQISSYAYEPIMWCTMKGIVAGEGNNKVNPKGTATRAQAAQVLMNYMKKYSK
jgi:hypothetical protein